MSIYAEDRFILDMKAERDYWFNRLSRELEESNLPLDHKRSKVYSKKQESVSITIADATFQKLSKLSNNSSLLLYVALLTVANICLHKYTDAALIVVGSPAVDEPGTAALAGNVVPIVVDIDDRWSFRALLLHIRAILIEAYARQHYPFERLVQDLGIAVAENRCSLFDVVVTLEPFHGHLPTLRNDITLCFRQEAEQLTGQIDFNARLFERATIERFAEHYATVLQAGLSNLDTALHALPILSAAEAHQLVALWNTTAAPYSDHCVQQLFALQAERTPDRVALIYESQHLTYRGLDEQGNQLARYLTSLGIMPDTRVGLCVARSLDMLIGLLGILKAGGACVPLDPTYPSARLRFMIQDAQMPVLITSKDEGRRTKDEETQPESLHDLELTIDVMHASPASIQNPKSKIQNPTPDNLAYVIYTSGSTGTPKGVCMTHAVLVNLFEWQHQHAALPASARTLQLTSLNFDVSFQEIFATWLFGGTLVVASEALRQAIGDLPNFLATQRIERLFMPFVALQQLAELAQGQVGLCLRQVITAGEQLQITQPIQKFFRQLNDCTLYNQYGPSETHVVSAFALIGLPNRWPALPPIGRPIANAQLFILDRYQHPVAIGVVGELYIGGVALARGYLDRPDLTAERFVPNPFAEVSGVGYRVSEDKLPDTRYPTPATRLYRTGDMARYRPDGNIEYVGRIDQQVKIRGYRIELGEIETVLRQHPSIHETAVGVWTDESGRKRLVAYVVQGSGIRGQGSGEAPVERLTPDPQPLIAELRDFLAERLPAYMVPSAFVALEALPLTPTGKVNRRMLPAPDQARMASEQAFIAPRSRSEELLAQIWAAVLWMERVGLHDNFFALGGDSILGMQVVSRAKQAGFQLTLRQLFQHQTLIELARVASTAQAIEVEQGLVIGPVPLTPIQHWFFAQQRPEPDHYTMAVLLEARQRLDAALLEQTAQSLLAHHDALRLRYVHETDGWRQYAGALDGTAIVARADLSALPAGAQRRAIEAAAAALQTSLDLTTGPIMRIALFELGADMPARLLVVVHHAAIDGVSWRIILEDFQTVYQQLRQATLIDLPAKTTSFKDWAHHLAEYAQSPALKQEIDYWLTKPWANAARLPVDFPDGVAANTEQSACIVALSLSVEETRALLQELPAAYHTQINDVLLAALIWALAHWTGTRTLLINLEGHGREAITAGLDLSRTVGWYTTLFPVLIELGAAETPEQVLRLVKEQLHQIPNHGIGFGVLRYLSVADDAVAKLRALPQAEISFNYLGQFDQLADTSPLFRMAHESVGPMVSPHGMRFSSLYIGGKVFGGQLSLEFSYSANMYRRATIQTFADAFADALHTLIQRRQAAAAKYIPSDFPHAGLNQHDLDEVLVQLSRAVEG